MAILVSNQLMYQTTDNRQIRLLATKLSIFENEYSYMLYITWEEILLFLSTAVQLSNVSNPLKIIAKCKIHYMLG